MGLVKKNFYKAIKIRYKMFSLVKAIRNLFARKRIIISFELNEKNAIAYNRPSTLNDPEITISKKYYLQLQAISNFDVYTFMLHEKLIKSLLKEVNADALKEINIAEFGVWKGAWLAFCGLLVKEIQENNMEYSIYGFDTFEGMPFEKINYNYDTAARSISELERSASKLSNTSLYQVESLLEKLGISNFCRLKKGLFDETIDTIKNKPITLVHLDADLYESTIFVLKNIYPSIIPGGIILIDDFYQPTWSGVTDAVLTFFSDKKEEIRRLSDFLKVRDSNRSRYYALVIKE